MRVFPPGTPVVERKRKPDGAVASFKCDLLAAGDGFALVLFTLAQAGGFHMPVPIPSGTRSYGFFWEDRPYNAYRLVSSTGAILAHRFDAVADVQITIKEVSFRDLVLDWWVLPGDILLEEDRDEFDSLASAGSLSNRDIELVSQATDAIHNSFPAIVDELAALHARYVPLPH